MCAEQVFLKKAYDFASVDAAKTFYDEWADTYDQEITENGYATPLRCANALAAFSDDLTEPVLDVGCGTGMSGQALRDAGFTTIDGSDLSNEMLALAAKKPAIYRDLWQADMNDPFPFNQGTYQSVSAMGVIAIGYAPPQTIDLILDALDSGGLLVFSLNDLTLKDRRFEARIAEQVDSGGARLLLKENGPHLPGIAMESIVYVLQKR